MANPASASLLASLRTATNLSLAELADLNEAAFSSLSPFASLDARVSRQLWRDELGTFARTLEDRQFAADLQVALRENRTVEAVRRERETRARTATTQAMGATGHMNVGGFVIGTSTSASTISTSRTTLAATSSSSASTSISCASKPNSCFICFEPSSMSILLPCGHRYCPSCLRSLFLAATKDESLNPASCCKKPVLSSTVYDSRLALSTQERTAYTNSIAEFATKNRLYCANQTCSSFLGKASDGGARMISCWNCGQRTCSSCKSPEHPSNIASAADSDDSAAAKLATSLYGKRCTRCSRVVVRNGGCPHVVCICGTDLEIVVDTR
ncbi:hypothetical protein JCM8097_007748 [Rhodosporidiobolus ruineniae]